MKQRVLTSIENLSKIVYSLLIWDNDMTTAQVCPAIFSLIFFLFPGFALSQFVGTSYIGAKMLVIQDLSYYELVYLFLGMFCQLHQTKRGGNNSVWTWLVSLPLETKLDCSERKKEATHLFWDLTDDQQLKPNIFPEQIWIIFLQKRWRKSDQRPRIPLKPMLPPLLLLYRYLSNWRSRSWKLLVN